MMISEPQSESPKRSPFAELAGKYLTFKLDAECYALGILNVREIIELIEITPVPRSNPDVKGVINLRGKVIPVVDLKLRLCQNMLETTDQTVIIVLQYETRNGTLASFGVMVDEVLEVVTVSAEEVLPPPDVGEGLDRSFLVGVARVHDQVTFLLDVSMMATGH